VQLGLSILILVAQDLQEVRDKIREITRDVLSKSTGKVRHQSASKPHAFIVISLQGPNNVKAEFVHVESLSKPIDKPTECNKSVLCHFFEGLEYHD